MKEKLKIIRNRMVLEKIDTLIITDPYQIFYITGIFVSPGERFLAMVVDNKSEILFLNELFKLGKETSIKIIFHNDTDNPIEQLSVHLNNTVGVDKNLNAKFLLPIIENNKECKFVLGSFILDELRQVKNDDEIDKMRKVSNINDLAMEKIKAELSKNLNELEMEEELKKIYKEVGSNEFSFEPIIAYGKNGADPHHENDESHLKIGDSIIIDMGCIYDKYCSDMTRTFFYKTATEEQIKVYNTVLKANLNAISKVKPGATCKEVDEAARKVIEDAGYGKYFTHRTGHFIGIEVHEYGDISSTNEQILKEGNIFSIEPGIYLPDKFGVRIEDLVLVTKDGCEVLNNYSKKLSIIK